VEERADGGARSSPRTIRASLAPSRDSLSAIRRRERLLRLTQRFGSGIDARVPVPDIVEFRTARAQMRLVN